MWLFLFAVAFVGRTRGAARGGCGWLRSPLVYTLSLSIYCTAWTFYGAVGYAARSGLEYVTIYLGPTLVMIGWWWVLRKLVRIGRTPADHLDRRPDLVALSASRTLLAVFVTVLAVVGTTPYIALQLQSVTLSLRVFAAPAGDAGAAPAPSATALWVAAGLALFTILFGTRNLDANERHHGVVMAIAVEAVVKLVALLAVGIFVVWGAGGRAGGDAGAHRRLAHRRLAASTAAAGPALTFLSAAAFLCLPRMFQVLVVENDGRAAPAHRLLGLSALPDADEPVRRADRRGRAAT